VSKVPVILAIGMKEVEEKTVSMRRLGSKQSEVLGIESVVMSLSIEAKAPDLK
jgi:threonyl-tRNA synthetase